MSAPEPDRERSSPDNVVVMGASAGGIEALQALLGKLPPDLPSAVLVCLHMGAGSHSVLARVLARSTELPVTTATDDAALRPAMVYTAQPDYHLLLRDGRLRLGRGPRENGHRPAIDPLFRSAARWYGERATAVVLSGALDDGAAGALTVAAHGGAVLVQDPEEALYDGMPAAVQRVVRSARVATVADLAGLLQERVEELHRNPPARPASAPTQLIRETDIAELDPAAVIVDSRPGVPSGLACPDCHGVLFEINDQGLLRYRCRVGHAWSPESLAVEQSDELESALWVALRTLEERAALHRKLAGNAQEAGRTRTASLSHDRALEADRSAEVIRQLLLTLTGERNADES